MGNVVYSGLSALIFMGTKLKGPDFTAQTLQRLGRTQKALRLHRRGRSIDSLQSAIGKSLDVLPLPLQCLERSLLTWYALNLHDHPASIKIGVTLTPLMSHAWVECQDQVFGDSDRCSDFTVIAEYPAWN
jgi:hypothetical protein